MAIDRGCRLLPAATSSGVAETGRPSECSAIRTSIRRLLVRQRAVHYPSRCGRISRIKGDGLLLLGPDQAASRRTRDLA